MKKSQLGSILGVVGIGLSTPGCLEPTEVERVDTDSMSSGAMSGQTESGNTMSSENSGTSDPGPSTDPSATASQTGTSGPVTSADSGGDTDPSTDSSGSTGTLDPGTPMFMATGHMGRTTFSCDEGQSWAGNRAFDTNGDVDACSEVQPVICYDDASGCQFLDEDVCQQVATNCDCDHHPGQGLGIAYGDGWWVGTFGWGPAPGSVRRSIDGVTWEVVVEDTTFGGLTYGNGTFLAGDRQPLRSQDGGATWQPTAPADFVAANGQTIYNVRRVGFADVDGGRFIIVATSGDNRDILLSSDEGDSWWRPAVRPEICLNNTRAILSGNDTIVLLGSTGVACSSLDGGETWSEVTVAADGFVGADGVWDGTAFQWWDGGQRYRSVDGTTWTTEAMSPSLELGAVAADPQTGKLVAVRGGWTGSWYEGQEFYRSDDGVNWVTLDPGTFVGSHRISRISIGHVQDAVCL